MQDQGQIDEIYAEPVGTTTVATLLTGNNNIRHYAWPNPARLSDYTNALAAGLAYAAIPNSDKTYANNPGYSAYSFSLSGSWSATTTYTAYGGSAFGEYTTTLGDTATTNIKGTSIYIIGTKTDSASGGIQSLGRWKELRNIFVQ